MLTSQDYKPSLEPSSSILHHHYLTRGSMLTSQDYNPSSVIYVPDLHLFQSTHQVDMKKVVECLKNGLFKNIF